MARTRNPRVRTAPTASAAVDLSDHGEMEQRPGGGAHRLRVVDVDRGRREHDPRRRRRRLPSAARYPALPGSRTSCRIATHPFGGSSSSADVDERSDPHQPLRRDGGREPAHHVLGDGLHVDARPRVRGPRARSVSSHTNSVLEPARFLQRFGNRLGALHQEPALRLTGCPLLQPGGGEPPSGSWAMSARGPQATRRPPARPSPVRRARRTPWDRAPRDRRGSCGRARSPPPSAR